MEWKDIVKKLQNPDTVAEGLTDLNDWKTANDASLTALQTEKAANENRIRELQDSNMKLYLRVTGEQTPGDEKKEPETFDELLAKVKEDNKKEGE